METIADVRRALNHMRTTCMQQSPEAPLNLATLLEESHLTFSEWSFAFVQMHHRKRHQQKA